MNVYATPTETLNATTKDAHDATTIYFTYYDPATVTAALAKIPMSGGPITNLLSVSASIAMFSVPLDGEPVTPTQAWGGTRGFGGVALDDRYIYFSRLGEIGGGLARVCK